MSQISLIVTKSNRTLTTATMHECIIVVHLEVVCNMSLGEQYIDLQMLKIIVVDRFHLLN